MCGYPFYKNKIKKGKKNAMMLKWSESKENSTTQKYENEVANIFFEIVDDHEDEVNSLLEIEPLKV